MNIYNQFHLCPKDWISKKALSRDSKQIGILFIGAQLRAVENYHMYYGFQKLQTFPLKTANNFKEVSYTTIPGRDWWY